MTSTAAAKAAQPDGDRVVATIPNGRRGEELRVYLSFYKGRPYFGMRTWYEDQAGDMKPGKGVNTKLELLPAIAEAVNAALAKAKADGLIE